jgi:ATP-dependent RNA helicase DDX19/DBP5
MSDKEEVVEQKDDSKKEQELSEEMSKASIKPVSSFKDQEEHEVLVTLADGTSSAHLYQSVTTFEELGLKPELLKGVYNMGYQKPSRIQANALPLLLEEPAKNMIGQSQAGTGKTACFSLNILSRVDTSVKSVQAICLAPARELARQILDNIRYDFNLFF